MKIKHSKLTLFFTSMGTVVILAAVASWADERGPGADGTWTWSVPGRNGGPERISKLKLKTEGAKLTGQLSAPGRDGQNTEAPIIGGKVEGDTLSFLVVRQINGTTATNTYTGKLVADKITGKIGFVRDGQPQSRDWEAKRVGEAK